MDNLIGQQTLTWTVVKDAFFRKLTEEGYGRTIAEKGAMGLRDFLRTYDFFE